MNLPFLERKLKNYEPKIMGSENFKRYAVLLPIIEMEGKLQLLFEVRSLNLRRQPGEICFPGGKVDKSDKNEQETAIRETIEELGIEQEDIMKIFPLDYMLSPFGTIIHPFVGFLKQDTTLNINHDEVGEVFSVPIDYLTSVQPEIYDIHFELKPENNFPFDKIIGGEDYNWQHRKIEEYFYYYDDKVIWGLTAKILTHFLSLLK